MSDKTVNTPVLVELQPMSGEAKPVTTSLKVAEYFGKRHDNVLRDIKDVRAKCSESFGALNFEESTYVNTQGKEQPMYLITRDGFMIVAMGYTGEKAMQLKEAYITAFNEMERRLQRPSQPTDALSAARIVFSEEDNQIKLALDKIFRREVGYSALETAGIRLLSPKPEVVLTPTEIGQQLNPVLSARVVNHLLGDEGYQERVGKFWQPTAKAAGMYELLDVGKSRSDGTPVKQLKWYSSTVDIVRELVGQKEGK